MYERVTEAALESSEVTGTREVGEEELGGGIDRAGD